jgi:glycosyltransferase involved in cell wall biosynthesis
MNILVTVTGYPRWKDDYFNIYLDRFTKELVKKKVKVHVLAPHAPKLKKFEIVNGVNIHRFQYLFPAYLQSLAYSPGIPEKIRTLKGKLQLPFFVFFALVNMLWLARKQKIDVINAHWATPLGFLAVLAKPLHRKPVLITLYGAELFPILKSKNGGLLKPFTVFALRGADKVVGISQQTCEAGRKISGRTDIEVVPDGIDIHTFNPRVSGKTIRRNLGAKGFMLFTSGRMVERKGFRFLIEALSDIIRKFPKTTLVIGGDGPEKENLLKTVRKLKLDHHVIFPGFIDTKDFPQFMRAADVFILPSIIDRHGDTEGSATILLEAMACETPVVGTRVGGVPFAITDGLGGFLVKQKSSKELAAKIKYLLDNSNIRKAIAQKGRKHVVENFGVEIIAKKYAEIFKIIIK